MLIPQCSTAAGIMEPLTKVESGIFSDPTQELEAQGVRRDIVADIFDLTFRTYQEQVNGSTHNADFHDSNVYFAYLLQLFVVGGLS
jgi:hypothetical protein